MSRKEIQKVHMYIFMYDWIIKYYKYSTLKSTTNSNLDPCVLYRYCVTFTVYHQWYVSIQHLKYTFVAFVAFVVFVV